VVTETVVIGRYTGADYAPQLTREDRSGIKMLGEKKVDWVKKA